MPPAATERDRDDPQVDSRRPGPPSRGARLGTVLAVIILLALVAAAPLVVAVVLLLLAVTGFVVAARTQFLPIVFASTLFVVPARYAFGPYKVTVSALAGLVCLGLWFGGRIAGADRAIPGPSRLLRALVVYVVAVVGTFAVAQLRGVTGVEARAADRRLIFTLAAVGLVVYLVDVAREPRMVGRVVRAAVAGGAVMAAIGIVQFATGFDPVRFIALPGFDAGPAFRVSNTGLRRVASTADHPIEFGVVCAMMLPLAMHLASFASTRAGRRLAAAASALLLAGALLAVSRSAALGLAAVLLLTVPRFSPPRRFAAVVSLLAGLAAFAILVPDLPSAISALFTDTSSDPSIQGRTAATQRAFTLIGEAPFLGRGFGTWEPTRTFVVDNQYLVTLLESGVVGLTALVGLGAVALGVGRGVARRTEAAAPDAADLARALRAAILAGAVGGVGLNVLRFQTTAGAIFLCIGLLAALERLHLRKRARRPRLERSPARRGTRWPSPAVAPAHVDNWLGASDVGSAVTLVVVTHNSADDLPGLVESLPAGMDGIDDWTLVVVDSGSTDDTPSRIGEIAPEARVVILDGNRGYAAGINAGLSGVPPTIAGVVLNPDIRLGRGAVRAMLDVLGQPGIGMVGPRMNDIDDRLALSIRRRPSLGRLLAEAVLGGRLAERLGWSHVVGERSAYATTTEADWLSGAALAMSRRCLDAVGPWDESFFLYAEDIDFGLRVNAAGFGVRLAPTARATHLGGEARTSPRLWSVLLVNRVRLYRKHRGAAVGALAWCIVTCGEAVRALAGRKTSRVAFKALMSRQWRPSELR